MSKFEDTIEAIGNKAELVRIASEIDPETTGALLLTFPLHGEGKYTFRTFGGATYERWNWEIDMFKDHLLHFVPED